MRRRRGVGFEERRAENDKRHQEGDMHRQRRQHASDDHQETATLRSPRRRSLPASTIVRRAIVVDSLRNCGAHPRISAKAESERTRLCVSNRKVR